MSELKTLLTKIHNTCRLYPENFIAGYVCSLIEGNPDEEVYETWKEARTPKEKAKEEVRETGDATDRPSSHSSPKIGARTDEGGSGEREHADARVDDKPNRATRCRPRRHNGGGVLRSTRRTRTVGSDDSGTVSPATTDVTDGQGA